MSKLIVSLLLVGLVGVCFGVSFQDGTTVNTTLAYFENVRLSAIPFTQRTKNVFYINDYVYQNQTRVLIKAITAIDNQDSAAQVIVTAGGVGSYFVNMRIRSGKGDGLDYQVNIFV